MREIRGDLWDYLSFAVVVITTGGGLQWPEVRPILARHFDERFLVSRLVSPFR